MTEPRTQEMDRPGTLESLAVFLRDNPTALNDKAEDLAAEFGLPVEFVANVQAGLKGPQHDVSEWERFRQIFSRVTRQVGDTAARLWSKLSRRLADVTAQPVPFLVATTLIFWAVVGVLRFATRGAESATVVGVVVGLAAFMILLCLQLVCYFRHGRARYPMVGTGLVVVSFFLFGLIGQGPNLRSNLPISGTILLLFGALMVGVLYGVFGFGASLAGGYVRLTRESREDKKLSRQELVGRLLELEAQLKRVDPSRLTEVRSENFFERARQTPWFPGIAFLIGVFYGVFEVSLVGTYYNMTGVNIIESAQSMPAANLGFIAILILLFFSSMILYCVVGYIAGRVWRSIVSVGLMWVGHILTNMVPYGNYGIDYVQTMMGDSRGLQSIFFTVGVGVLTGIGASIDLSHGRKRRLNSQDPAQLVAEAVQLQWRLNLGSRAACVMSVDVAGSTKMKAGADPLRIEYSFREYQQMVEEISQRYGGHVFSTAGDGAIVAFPSCEVALDAAREIQTEMPAFNARRNRLDHPFRVRVGLHTGETQAQLGDAPFNELIDIAAHVEKVAPVGGIALSGQAAAKVPDVRLVELAQSVDGQKVYIDIDPTKDA